MIAHRGIYRDRITTVVALDRDDLAKLLSGTPLLCYDPGTPLLCYDLMIHFIERPQEAARYANDVLTKGEKL